MPIRDLHLDGEGPTYDQIYRALRDAILGGRARPGERLPATRELARDLGVSRTTVLAAYDQLLAEGYAAARVGSGTYVAPQLPEGAGPRPPPGPAADAVARPRLSRLGERLCAARPSQSYRARDDRDPVAFDFVYCLPDADALSYEAWDRTASRRALHARPDRLSYGAPAGLPALREAVAAYLARARGVDADPARVVICSGVAQALDLSARLFVDEGDGVVLEEPHYTGARHRFAAAGARILPVPVDDDGLDTARLPAPGTARCKLAYVTPSHQFPAGAVLSLRRRLALLDWAERADAYVIEDDYDSEFRYAGRSIASLKSLDERGRVLYVGTFSKTLFPGLRAAYMLLPEPLVEPFVEAKWLADWSAATPLQEALVAFLESGDYERHIRRARTLYGRRREAFVGALRDGLGPRARFRDAEAGLHVRVALPGVPAARTRALVGAALDRGVAVYPSRSHYVAPPDHVELIMGFTRVDEADVREGLARLAAVIDAHAAPVAAARAAAARAASAG